MENRWQRSSDALPQLEPSTALKVTAWRRWSWKNSTKELVIATIQQANIMDTMNGDNILTRKLSIGLAKGGGC